MGFVHSYLSLKRRPFCSIAQVHETKSAQQHLYVSLRAWALCYER